VSEWNSAIRRIKPDGAVTTFVFAGSVGLVDGSPGTSRFRLPRGMAPDSAGNLYVADYSNHAIRRISPRGDVTTVAGNGTSGQEDGPAGESSFEDPTAVAVDPSGNVYVADRDLVRKISRGEVSTLAGVKFSELRKRVAGTGPYPPPTIRSLGGIAVGPDGVVYAADSIGNRIVKIASNGAVIPVAGGALSTFFGTTCGYRDGPTSIAEFDFPHGIAVGSDGAIYVADSGNHAIRKIKWGWVSTVAGGRHTPSGIHDFGLMPVGGYVDGPGAEAEFSLPTDVTIDGRGNLLVADHWNRAIRRIDGDGFVSTLFGPAREFDTTLGPLPASVGIPEGVAVLADGRLAISVLNGILVTDGVRF
jgi:sugar lactone lactonase YvrE